MYVALSPAYAVRNESNGSFLISVNKIIDVRKDEFGAFSIPPFLGYILSHIGDLESEEAIKIIANDLGISSSAVKHFVDQLIENPEHKEFKYSDTLSVVFPPMLLNDVRKNRVPMFMRNRVLTPKVNTT